MAHHAASAQMPSASKGSDREVLVREFLTQVFPPQFRFGSGAVVDAQGGISGQLDVVIEFPFLPSFPAPGAKDRLYLAESVALALEVKSSLNAQWPKIRASAGKLLSLRRDWRAHGAHTSKGATQSFNATVSWIPFLVVAYKGPASGVALSTTMIFRMSDAASIPKSRLPPNERVRVFEEKIEEYFASFYPEFGTKINAALLEHWPLFRFSIARLHGALLLAHVDGRLGNVIGDKLIDIKLHFAYLLSIDRMFYRGVTLIVGNDEIGKLNPNTISLLRGTHYRVFLLSVVIEQTLDLLWLILEGATFNGKKGKWNKILASVEQHTGEKIVTGGDAALLLDFKEHYRTAEMHKFSAIRGLTGKQEWTHLQDESVAIANVLARLFAHFGGDKPPSGPWG